jgi:hypothetical protein
MRMLVSDRIRTGTGTWALRAEIFNLCKEDMIRTRDTSSDSENMEELPNSIPRGVSDPNNQTVHSVCLIPETQLRGQEANHQQFVKLLTTVAFVACVRGGGLDPSPKAWEALRAGTIPIIEFSTVNDGYEHFPVVFVEDWKELIKHPNGTQLLRVWANKLAPYYEEGSELRKKVLEVGQTITPNLTYWSLS